MDIYQDRETKSSTRTKFSPPASRDFRNFAELASCICGSKYAMINFLDGDQYHTEASYGINPRPQKKENTLCWYASLENSYLLIPDAKKDERFNRLPVVTSEPGVRFYCGCNIYRNGKTVGTLCVADTEPKRLNSRQLDALKSLTEEVQEKLDHIKINNKLNETADFLQSSSDLIFKIDIKTGIITDIQGAVQELTGNSPSSIIGRSYKRLIADQVFISAFENLSKDKDLGKRSLESFLLHRMCFLDIRMLKREEEIFVAARNITTKKMTERGHKKSLKEKQVLLEEIHHRVKNNLALISSLLLIEEFNTNNNQVRGILEKSQNRIKSMSLIHEVLYSANSYVQVPIKSFLEEYIRSFENRLNKSEKDILIESEIHGDGLNLNQAVPCALIINELVSNSFEHAFEGLDKGKINISLRIKDETFSLMVKDDGVGLSEGWDIEQFDTVGFTLIKTLIGQLDGLLDHKNSSGAEFTIKFKKEYSKGSQSSLSDDEISAMLD